MLHTKEGNDWPCGFQEEDKYVKLLANAMQDARQTAEEDQQQ